MYLQVQLLLVSLRREAFGPLVDQMLEFYDGHIEDIIDLNITYYTTQNDTVTYFYLFRGEPRRKENTAEAISENDLITMTIDNTTVAFWTSFWNLMLVLFVLVLLLLFSTTLNGTCNRLVVVPLERMFRTDTKESLNVMRRKIDSRDCLIGS